MRNLLIVVRMHFRGGFFALQVRSFYSHGSMVLIIDCLSHGIGANQQRQKCAPINDRQQRFHANDDDRDPYNGLSQSLYNWVVFHPLYNPTNQGFFSLLRCHKTKALTLFLDL